MTMSAWSVVLRVCLCVALVFNGATTAMASAQMAHLHAEVTQPGEPASQPAPGVVADADEAMPCHEHQAQSAQSTNVEQGIAPDDGSPKSKHPAPDCCKSGTCRCACMQHGAAAIPMVAFNAIMVEHADSVRSMAWGHASPTLPHLIRPPIG